MPLDVAEPRDCLAYAEAYAEHGYTRCIPLPLGKKFPPLVKWKPYQSRNPTVAELHEWFAGKVRNLAVVVAENLVVVDAETPEMRELVFTHCGETPMWSQTPRGGGHIYYRRRAGVDLKNEVKLKGRAIDFRVHGSYIIEEPSVGADDIPYLWQGDVVPVEQLPILKVSWLRDYAKQARRKAQQLLPPPDDDADVRIRRATGYVACIEGAISGQRGHDCTMRVASILIQKFRLEIDEALAIFKQWNETCEPPWEEKELIHKLRDAKRLREAYCNENR